ncbi:MAG TPA: hypothetical protein VJH24_05660 [Candidatus Bilamarchaeaceae archaeon]|nr:hypothetical protein [Candidatus Bilamarchaeaceae archaeon]
MENYIVNSTFVAYLADIYENSLFPYVQTIKEVKEELGHLRGIFDIRIEEIASKDQTLQKGDWEKYLSEVDLSLLRTAKASKKILITDDKKLAKAAQVNGVSVLNTPRFIATLAFNGILKYDVAVSILEKLLPLYNRKNVLKKVLKDLNNWR